ncbi:BnaA09g45260D [Brassica napus]|uniref:BnaA09g45260D protein n=1 Tax=Brassica napus TaxID=3708 RepID=A0A078H532_BRANA|nr:BnaA09g45260D [Brassica napus]
MATIPPQLPLATRSALRRASSSVHFFTSTSSFRHRATKLFLPRAFSSSVKLPTKLPLCTADELHYVSVPNSDWRLALWRYFPPPQTPTRNHPLLLLSGVGTNAIGYDLSPGCSFARHMSAQGFETWILEVRGAGLSTRVSDLKDVEDSAHELSHQIQSTAKAAAKEAQVTEIADTAPPASDVSVVGEEASSASAWDESKISVFMSAKLFDKIAMLLEDSRMYERFNEIRSKLLSLIESRQNSGLGNQIRELTQRLLIDLQERLTSTIEDFQKQLDLIVKYDWDFDNYLEEDVPAAIEYVRAQCKPKDGKLFAIGHSMGGILLYAMLSRCAFEGREPCLAAVATLASSLDYTTSDSALKLLIPLADPAQALSVPVVPLGALLAAAYPLSSRPPYVLSWLNDLISATDMMHPEQLEKLVLNNFCTIPAKLLIQLTTAFREGGLRDRSGEFYYKDHLSRTSVPVLALAGDRDLICPPIAVEDTVKLFPENLVTYKLLGEPDGPHYAHYDLVGGRLAVEQVYPCITEFLSHHDSA